MYKVPLIVFIITCVIMYYVNNSQEKNNYKFITYKCIAPSIVVAATVFFILKYRDNIDSEQLMTGNYFD